LALRITPIPHYSKYNPELGDSYSPAKLEESYYDSKFIYNKVGYWPDEYYRLGVVFMLKDNTLSSVYNIRGKLNLTDSYEYKSFDIRVNDERKYIDIRDNIIVDSPEENSIGVITIQENADDSNSPEENADDSNSIIGIKMELQEGLLEELATLGIQGLFFVRQTRIPITICQALTIGTD